MRILVTGGTGKTGRRVAGQARAAGHDVRIATRTPRDSSGIAFDWTGRATWGAALDGIDAVYLVAGAGIDPAATMIPFAEAAIGRGVKRFVLLSASLLDAGGPGPGQVHAWLATHAAEWAVLRPSWFMQNFSEGQHLAAIRAEGAIYTAAADGRIPFIDAGDIASAAVAALTTPASPNTDVILTGPDAISYDDAARAIGAACGRQIEHRRLTMEGLAARHIAKGLPEMQAQILAFMDTMIATGAENRTTDAVQTLTGRPPTGFDAFARVNAGAWRA